MDIQVNCSNCGHVQSVTGITEDEWIRYRDGALVQDVWPDRSDEEREAIVGIRTGFYVCPTCWEELFGEEDES